MIHPAFARLLLTLPHDLDGARLQAEPARAALRSLREEFETRALAIPQREDGAALVDEVRGLLDDMDAAITKLLTDLPTGVVGEPTVEALQDAAAALQRSLQQLDGWDQARPRLAPIPPIDRFIATGMNVRDHRVDAATLREQVPDLVRLAATLTADLERFRLLYPDAPAPADAYLAELRKIQAGVNAARAWTAAASDAPLLDALRLLHSGGNGLLTALQEMDTHVRTHARFSRIVAVEEVRRCAEALREGRLSAAVFAQSVAHLEGLLDFLEGAAVAGTAFPLAFEIRTYAADLDEQARTLRRTATPWLERARASALQAATDTTTLEVMTTGLEACTAAQERLQERITELLALFASAPQLLDVVATIARATRGEVPHEGARQHAEEFLGQLQALQHELAAHGPSEDAFETRTLLADQAEALAEMLAALDDGDERHLRDGVGRLRKVLPRLDAVQRDLRAGADAQRRAREQGVSCFRCGASNVAGQRYCNVCSAVLPAHVPQETVYTDIVGADESLELPENLQTLQNLFVLAETGGDTESISSALASLHAGLQDVARQYEEGIASRGDALPPSAAEYGSAFSDHLQQLIEAIETMYNGAQHGRLDAMGRGLQAALTAGQEMQDLQVHMQQNAVQ